jgi:hypothetical protein
VELAPRIRRPSSSNIPSAAPGEMTPIPRAIHRLRLISATRGGDADRRVLSLGACPSRRRERCVSAALVTAWRCCSRSTPTVSTVKSRSRTRIEAALGASGADGTLRPLRTSHRPGPRNRIVELAKPQFGRARLVADGGGLENRFGGNPDVGSNPTPSARGLAAADRPVGSVVVEYRTFG